ncbi:AAA family ATPase [Microbacterium sp. zg.B48]|uniref:AAA family ATPase n=1 Tax=Microbacterium sp. zg.B48 TaxID=2969408 RepID=UPI00214BCCDF|nr:AAA family ATPase [Microbacterium sp. zg.B48]MCR2764986.1 AAA family ATPase [Microbacterium sp. zg.B48]
MTTPFRLESVNVRTVAGDVSYQFPSALTVLAGSVGVGKSTLFELIKHALGGRALLAEVARTSVLDVSVDIRIGASRYLLTRSVDPETSAVVRVRDLVEQTDLEDHFTDKREPSLSSLLLSAMGVPDDMRAASRASNSTKQGARISFADIFKYMYVSQGDINKEIAGSEDSYYTPKRKAVFELLFALTNPSILESQSSVARLRGEYDDAQREHAVVLQFLEDSGAQSRFEAIANQADANAQIRESSIALEHLRESIRPAIDRETRTLRDLLGEAERSLADALNTRSLLEQQHADFAAERAHVQQDISRLERMSSAGERLAQIEFSVCPRCMQNLKSREAPPELCRLCLQPDPLFAAEHSDHATYELVHLREQDVELATQVLGLSAELQLTGQNLADRSRLVDDLSRAIQDRTQNRITPQLQAYTDATARLASAEGRSRELEQVMRFWDRADDLEMNAQGLGQELKRMQDELDVRLALLAERRREVFGELDNEFADNVRAIGVPGVRSAKIDHETYLPVLNDQPLKDFSPVGGVRTATQVAYWVTLMNVALRRRDTLLPAFLLIDSPRTSLNDNDELSAALYRRLVTMADAAEGRVQLVVGDNELPAAYRRDYAQMDFDYAHPTIATIHHPGRDAVETIST